MRIDGLAAPLTLAVLLALPHGGTLCCQFPQPAWQGCSVQFLQPDGNMAGRLAAAIGTDDALFDDARGASLLQRAGTSVRSGGPYLGRGRASSVETPAAAEPLAAARGWAAGNSSEALAEHARVISEDAQLRRRNAELRQSLLRAALADEVESASGHGMVVALVIAAVIVGCCSYVGFRFYSVMRTHCTDSDGDGDVDIYDFGHAVHIFCLCGLNNKGLRSLFLLFVAGSSGFAFLWWKHIIQPFLLNLMLYGYLAAFCLYIGLIFAGEAFVEVKANFNKVMAVVHRVERFFSGDFSAVVESETTGG